MEAWVAVHQINRILEAAPLVPFACACLRREHIPEHLRLVFYYVAARTVIFALDVLSRITIFNNIYLFHLGTVLMVLLLAGTYQRLLPAGWLPVLLRAGVGLFLLVAVLDAVWLNGLLTDVNSYAQAMGCTLLVTLAMLHVVDLTRRAPFVLEKQPEFFFSVGILLYCSCSVVTYVAINLLYSASYDKATIIRLDTLLSSPDTFLAALQMVLFAWMFCFFPLSVAPRRALPQWLHYSSWARRPYRVLGQPRAALGSPAGVAEGVGKLNQKAPQSSY